MGKYPDHLVDQYTGLGAQKNFSSFVFSVAFQKKYVELVIK